MTDIRPDTTARRFQPPTWQDWANIVLAVWFFCSPWILQFGLNAPMVANPDAAAPATVPTAYTAAWNAWVLGVIVFLASVTALGRFARQQEWVNLILGIWIFIAPWVLGFGYGTHAAAAWDHWIVGALIFLIAAAKLAATRRAATAPPPASRN